MTVYQVRRKLKGGQWGNWIAATASIGIAVLRDSPVTRVTLNWPDGSKTQYRKVSVSA